jgi:hypothetical protein
VRSLRVLRHTRYIHFSFLLAFHIPHPSYHNTKVKTVVGKLEAKKFLRSRNHRWDRNAKQPLEKHGYRVWTTYVSLNIKQSGSFCKPRKRLPGFHRRLAEQPDVHFLLLKPTQVLILFHAVSLENLNKKREGANHWGWRQSGITCQELRYKGTQDCKQIVQNSGIWPVFLGGVA